MSEPRRPSPRSLTYASDMVTYESAMVARKLAHEEEEIRDRQRELDRAINAIGIPPKDLVLFRSGLLSRTKAIEDLETPGVLICLSGNPGSGKTTAAGYRLFLAACGMFIKAAKLARWPRYDDAEMERLFTRNPIAIDDLGTEYQDAKGNFMAILDEVIDVRYDHSRPTYITTNLDASAFKERYGERIADRIRESGRFVSLSDASMRGRK
jgi:DNA replication protein DnaC